VSQASCDGITKQTTVFLPADIIGRNLHRLILTDWLKKLIETFIIPFRGHTGFVNQSLSPDAERERRD